MGDPRSLGPEACPAAPPPRAAPPRCRPLVPVLALLLAALGSACSDPPSAEGVLPCRALRVEPPSRPPNVVLIVNDTMRRDRLGSYGGPADTPAFDAFAREGVLFTQASSPAPWTKPTMASLFTSLHPSQHGVASDPQLRNPFDGARKQAITEADVLSPDWKTLAEAFQEAGYRTAAFVSNPWLGKRFGFDQGFELYDDSFARWGLKGAQVSESGLAWLRAQSGERPFFLYLHYLDSHLPYGRIRHAELLERWDELAADDRPLGPQASLAAQQLPRLPDGRTPQSLGLPASMGLIELAYDSGLSDFDRALETFLAGFDERPSASGSLVLITSDHGEALFANGYGNHGNGLFDDEIAVPLVLRLPGGTGRGERVDCPVGLIDVMPTLCSYLALPCPGPMFGRSFLDTGAEGQLDLRRYIVAEGVVSRPSHRAIRNGSWKLLWETGMLANGKTRANPYSLYNIREDPEERRDLLLPENRSPATDAVFRTLSRALSEAVPEVPAPAPLRAPVDPELSERLRSLGYTE